MKENTGWDRVNRWAKSSVTLKLLIIGVLILVLLIPSGMIQSLIWERQSLRDTAITEVSGKWGLQQTISGPVLSVPYEVLAENDDGKKYVSRSGFAHFLPEDLDISGDMLPEKKKRGIYMVVLYNTKLKVKGRFADLNLTGLNISPQDIKWDKALVTMGISDMKGIKKAIDIKLNGEAYQMGPGTVTNDMFGSGANTPVDLTDKLESLTFEYELDLNGSTDLYFTPFGKETKVTLNSNWVDPSFEGSFLPTHKITDTGFKADWKVLQFNRNYPQKGLGAFINASQNNSNKDYYLRQSTNAFGVKLLVPIDEYAKTQRSAKYALMFIVISFLTFFFIEVLNRKRLHPIQYLLVGAAIILFYILLLSISEHLNFDYAYWIACGACLSLITFYCHFILKNKKLTFAVFGILLILYGFFYSILQLQDYSLLLGSFGLLLILGTIMYLTRNIDWYGLRGELEESRQVKE